MGNMQDYSIYFDDSPKPTGRLLAIGKLHLPSGRVCCCDPFLSDEVAAFEKTISPGDFEVSIYFERVSEWGQRVALAGIVFSKRPVVSWHRAGYAINDRKFFDFHVDAGLACFMDEQTRNLFLRSVDNYYRKKPDGNFYDDLLAAQFKKNGDPGNPRDCGDWNMYFPAAGDPHNIAMFSSGLGDGVYSAYWGLDSTKHPAMLVVDFGLK